MGHNPAKGANNIYKNSLKGAINSSIDLPIGASYAIMYL
jgi:hypothetical protein